jgi:hypothetical protein
MPKFLVERGNGVLTHSKVLALALSRTGR